MTDCIHHWKIKSPDGSEFLPGECKKCGAIKEDFKASSPRYIPEITTIKKIDSLEELAEIEFKNNDEDSFDGI